MAPFCPPIHSLRFADLRNEVLGAERHSGADPRNSHRARRVALACEVVGEDHITRSKTARGAVADPDFHLPRENKNVLPPGRGVPIAPIIRREAAEHEVGTRLKCDVVASLGRQREISKENRNNGTNYLPRPACGERVGVRGRFSSSDSRVWRTPSRFSITSLFQMRITR